MATRQAYGGDDVFYVPSDPSQPPIRGVIVLGQDGAPAGDSSVGDIALLTAAAATGSWIAVTAGFYDWYAWGTWNGATAQLQYSPDAGTTPINFDGVTLTANGGWTNLALSAGHCRVSFTGSPTSISSKLGGVA